MAKPLPSPAYLKVRESDGENLGHVLPVRSWRKRHDDWVSKYESFVYTEKERGR